MNYKVSVSSGYNFSAKVTPPAKFKAIFNYTVEPMPNLNDLLDVQISGANDKYVLMYDATTGKWRNVNPDLVLSASSTTEVDQPGLPTDFIDRLDIDLDNKIDLDAGGF